MTTKEISDRIIARLDDDPNSPGSVATDPNSPVPFELIAAIKEGQELASWLTLCLEATVPLTLVANGAFYLLRSQMPDYLVPLRIMGPAGRIRPCTLAELDALNPTWQQEAGTPARYAANGFSFFAVNPQPVNDTTVQFTYARSPQPIVADAFLDLPDVYQPALIDYGVYYVKRKEGGQSLQRGMNHLNRFLDEMTKLGNYVRAKSAAARYDTLPMELALFDRSRLLPKRGPK